MSEAGTDEESSNGGSKGGNENHRSRTMAIDSTRTWSARGQSTTLAKATQIDLGGKRKHLADRAD
jgi:hypothetical protein